MNFDFPVAGDAIEICLDGYRGRRYKAERVYEYEGRIYVVVYDPCSIPGCTEHDDYSTVNVTAVKPHVSG